MENISAIFINDDEKGAKVFESVNTIHFLDAEFAKDEVICPALMRMGTWITVWSDGDHNEKLNLLFSKKLVAYLLGLRKFSENVKQSTVDVFTGAVMKAWISEILRIRREKREIGENAAQMHWVPAKVDICER